MGNICLKFIKQIISCEDTLFNQFKYIDPIYNIINYVVNSFPILDGGRLPSFNYYPSNIRLCKTSSGRHLASYFARKRICRKQQIISGPKKENDNNSENTNENRKNHIPHDRSYCYNNYTFYPNDAPSHCDDNWYDALSPYWTGGMVWGGAYVLNHQVVSATTDPIFVSNLLPGHELSVTIQGQEVRSEDKNIGPRATIALDSGSSIHIFKDAFLLTDINSDDKHSIGVCTTDSRFRVNNIGRLCDDLNTLPLPSEGYYYYYLKGVANILSLAMVAETKQVVMDSAIDNAIIVFNEDGSYIKFLCTPNGVYCIDINTVINSLIYYVIYIYIFLFYLSS
jgi:hypothetical protein